MRRVVLFMHVSLDGYTARENRAIDWINIDDEMFEYARQRTEESDIALYGRVTYELMQDYWPTAADQPNATKHDIEHSSWYNSVKKVIVSKTMKDAKIANTSIISENIAVEITKLKEETGKDIVMFGSPTVAAELMDKNLIDDYWLFVNPIILGKGIQLFKAIDRSINLKLMNSTTFTSGVVCLHYSAEMEA